MSVRDGRHWLPRRFVGNRQRISPALVREIAERLDLLGVKPYLEIGLCQGCLVDTANGRFADYIWRTLSQNHGVVRKHVDRSVEITGVEDALNVLDKIADLRSVGGGRSLCIRGVGGC